MRDSKGRFLKGYNFVKRKQYTTKCAMCENTFITVPSKHKKTCSVECYKKWVGRYIPEKRAINKLRMEIYGFRNKLNYRTNKRYRYYPHITNQDLVLDITL